MTEENKEKIISFLREMGIEYESNENKVLVYGLIAYHDKYEIVIGNNKGDIISFSYRIKANKMFIQKREGKLRELLLSKSINAYYSFPYLVITT